MKKIGLTSGKENKKLSFINEVVRDCGSVQLSAACGKYYALTDNGKTIVALSFEGRNGYGTASLCKLPQKVIDAIYHDLYQDFA